MHKPLGYRLTPNLESSGCRMVHYGPIEFSGIRGDLVGEASAVPRGALQHKSAHASANASSGERRAYIVVPASRF